MTDRFCPLDCKFLNEESAYAYRLMRAHELTGVATLSFGGTCRFSRNLLKTPLFSGAFFYTKVKWVMPLQLNKPSVFPAGMPKETGYFVESPPDEGWQMVMDIKPRFSAGVTLKFFQVHDELLPGAFGFASALRKIRPASRFAVNLFGHHFGHGNGVGIG